MRSKRTAPKTPKLAPIDPAAIWWAALQDLRHQLSEHCLTAKPDKLRFQTGRLGKNLRKRMEAVDVHRLVVSMFGCYQFVAGLHLQLGFDEPRRLHCEEMKAWGLQDSARSFCSSLVKGFANDPQAMVCQLAFRLASITDWMEAQESFGVWLEFKENRAFWRGNSDKRTHAFQAWVLAELPQYTITFESRGRQIKGARLWEGLGVGTDLRGEPWEPRQWANILEQAARFAEKEQAGCTEIERWIWWCYPIFSRYGWNAREVVDAASFREFPDKDSWKVIEKSDTDFRRYWITRGLRFAGKRRKREKPSLVQFVSDVSLPNLDDVRGVPVWGDWLRKKTDRT